MEGNCRGLMTGITTVSVTKFHGLLTQERLVGFRPGIDEVAMGQHVEQSGLQKLLGTHLRLCYANQECHFCFVDV